MSSTRLDDATASTRATALVPRLLSGLALWTCRAGLAGLVALLGVCMLGAVSPFFDRYNHFQPFLALASLGLLGLAWVVGEREHLAWYGLLAAVNVMLFFAPILRLPTHVLPAQGGERLKVMTFNYLYWQHRPYDVFDFIRAQSPDIVVLQEITHRNGEVLTATLRDQYPYRRFCNYCDVAIFSRLPWTGIREFQRDRRGRPPLMIASFARPDGSTLRVAGVHLMNPYDPLLQRQELATLTRELASATGPLILAGDFNQTPWSWALNRFADGLGLRRHTGVLGTWSTSRSHLLPWFPIDHILSTPDIRLLSIERGPKLGSDHLPVIATLVLPPP